ncbi:M48 family metalloprotease [Amaricoccus sp.]|mgnify:CR=1 FL=1|uniref:M48 family metalloprotease n=1 Tax=Amaricoccus sp. TaxID=1872485 RepID=UPI002603CC46|nr:M48 family metalloprotease [Amaricoccus sp.]HRO11691.1 M48 family metalloprotease [Amaricoccus sp.]
MLAVVAALAAGGPAAALSLIRDAEIEHTLGRIADPLLRAAGLRPGAVRIYIVSDREPNAFVAGGSNIFIHTGLMTELDSVDELRAVIAHEIGHITGGHLARRGDATRGGAGIAAIGMLGALAAAAGGVPEASVAIAAGSAQVAHRSVLAYSRGEEASADQAGLRYLAAAGGDPEAMLDVLDRFRGQDALLAAGHVDPYAQSHPMWSERMALIEDRVAKMPPGKPPSAEDAYWHGRMVAKLDAFLGSPAQTLRKYPERDGSEAAELARAIAWHRRPDGARAGAAMRALLAARPDDAYYLDLEAQFLLESGKAAAAAGVYRRAAGLAPKEPLILGGLGRALLNMDEAAATAEARNVLEQAFALDKANGAVLRDLALAEARLGNEGAAALATAERFAVEGRFRDADRNAERAAALLPEGSPGWRRAQDIISMARRALK